MCVICIGNEKGLIGLPRKQLNSQTLIVEQHGEKIRWMLFETCNVYKKIARLTISNALMCPENNTFGKAKKNEICQLLFQNVQF